MKPGEYLMADVDVAMGHDSPGFFADILERAGVEKV
jgi:hypothetical protein